jgi:hypothetical protein
MTMRRLGLLILALALAAPVAGLAVLLGGGPATMAKATVALLEAAGPRRAVAEVTTLHFKDLPSDSVSALERERPSRRRVRVNVDVPEVPDVPAVPEVPDTPAVPEPPPAPEHVTRAGDLTRVGSDIHIEQDEVVRGDVTAIRGDITVDGTVHGGVVSFGGDIYLNPTARVDGDVVCIGGELHEEPGAYVSGERVTALSGGRGERIARSLRVGRLRHESDWEGGDWARGIVKSFGALMRLLIFIGFAILVAWLFQGRIAVGAETLKRQPAVSLGIGALVHALFIPSIVALALVMALLCITIIGIPLALAALVGYLLFFVVFWVFGSVVGATVVGERIAARRGVRAMPLWQSALLGVLVVAGAGFAGKLLAITHLPGFGGLGQLVVVLSVIASIVMGLMGGGAWLKWEFTEGVFGRWRGRWESRNAARVPPAPYGPPPVSPYGPPAAAVPAEAQPVPPPVTPASPGEYMPPAPEPPPSGPAPGA